MGLAVLTAGQKPAIAARMLGAADTLGTADGAVPSPADQLRHEQAVATVTPHLSDEAFSAARAAGRSLTADQAVALALEQA
jgi:hypothetical protein